MDAVDRAIVNQLQGGFPVCERPYAESAAKLGLTEDELMQRLDALLKNGTLTRFGPMYRAERLGGALTLAAMAVPLEKLEAVAAVVNGYTEVNHNYEREHRLNLWFVATAPDAARLQSTLDEIAARTGYEVLSFPLVEDYHIDLGFDLRI